MCSMKYGYVGRWCGPGPATHAELIASEWIITAPHVVKNKMQNPDIDVIVCFQCRDKKDFSEG